MVVCLKWVVVQSRVLLQGSTFIYLYLAHNLLTLAKSSVPGMSTVSIADNDKCFTVPLSLASHTLHREEGSGQASTIELSPRQKLDVTSEVCTLCRLDPLSWSSNYVTCLADVSIVISIADCSVTRPFISLRRVWLVRLVASLLVFIISEVNSTVWQIFSPALPSYYCQTL